MSSNIKPVKRRVSAPKRKSPKKSLSIFETIEKKKNISSSESKRYKDRLDKYYKEKKIPKRIYKKYKEMLEEKQETQVDNSFSYTDSSSSKEKEDAIKPETKTEYEEPTQEKKKESALSKIKKGHETYTTLKKTGLIRLIGFVIIAIGLMLFITKNSLFGGGSNNILLFLIIFVIFFALGKGGENHIFDDFFN